MAPWPPRPLRRIVTVSAEAMNGPGRKPNLPTGSPGQLCMANTASQGNSRNKPSSTIFCAPTYPSSAGWKIRRTVPSKSMLSARHWPAASSIAVCPSWPQACILPSWRLA
jgi:hypothetical protein